VTVHSGVCRFARIAAVALAGIAFLTASAERPVRSHRAAGQIVAANWPLLPGSTLPVRVDGFSAPYEVALVGTGKLADGGVYAVPDDARAGTATVIVGNAHGLASRSLHIVSPPASGQSIVAVASYEDGVAIHASSDFSMIGMLVTGGAPSDVAIDANGRMTATDTQGTAATVATVRPWTVNRVDGVPLGDNVAVDESTKNVFITNRDVRGAGALTRITPDGHTVTVQTGETAEGLAVDARRQVVYVANVNDATVAAVDARTMRVRRRFHVVDRVFSLALSPDGNVLYAVSNQSADSPFAAPGSVVAVALDRSRMPVIARSEALAFPVGIALDPRAHRVLVTDESTDQIYVLDPRTLKAQREPLLTCHTPWQLSLDTAGERLYVPCARADRVDVIDARTLRRLPNAPFATGGYPLAVTVWHAH
jgi:DNA-binding beta-propeller fold protein YncE